MASNFVERDCQLARLFIMALRKDDPKIMLQFVQKRFIEKGLSVDHPIFPSKMTMLMFAAGNASEELVGVMIRLGAEIGQTD